MRRILIALAIALLPSIALAHGGGGHMGGGFGGGHIGGGFGGHMGVGFHGGHIGGGFPGVRMGAGALNSHAAVGAPGAIGRSGVARNSGRFHGHGHFVHRHGRRFFVGGGPWWGGYDNCWQWVPTASALRRVWACDDV